MYHSRAHHSKINRQHDLCLRIIYPGKTALEKDSSVSIHKKNLQLKQAKARRQRPVNKANKGLSPLFLTELFEQKNKHQHALSIPDANSVSHET